MKKLIIIFMLLSTTLMGQSKTKRIIQKSIKITAAIAVGVGSFYVSRELNLPKSTPYIVSSSMAFGITLELRRKKK